MTDSDTVTLTETDLSIDFPQLWGAKLHNDDKTPMDFVVFVLHDVFNLDYDEATTVMLNVHTKGSHIVGAYTREIAETKVMRAMQYAKQYHHPFTVEAVAV